MSSGLFSSRFRESETEHRIGAVQIGTASDALLREHGLDFVCDYWDRARAGRFAPAWRDIDLMEFPGELRAAVMVADVLDGGTDYQIRYWGVDLVEAFGIELSGRRLSESAHKGIMDSSSTPPSWWFRPDGYSG